MTCVCVWIGAGCLGEWVTGLGLGYTNSGGTWGKWDMCLCLVWVVLGCVCGVGGECVGGLEGLSLGGWSSVMFVL